MKYHNHNDMTERHRVQGLTNTTHKPHLRMWNVLPTGPGMWVADGPYDERAEDWCDTMDQKRK